MTREKRLYVNGLLFLLPAAIIFLCFVYYPFAKSIYYSFTQWDAIRAPKFIGLDNYRFLLEDRKMITGLQNTLLMTLFGLLVQSPLALLLAVALNRKFVTRNFLRTAFYLPISVSLVITSVVWGVILRYDGLFNQFLSTFGMEQFVRDWLGNIHSAFPTIILLTQWQAIGYCAVLYLAGLQGIPKELYEAAKIDGASASRQLWHITIPMLMPVITIVSFLTITGALKLFDLPYVLTNGGPGHSSYTVVLAIYKSAFTDFAYGYAAAVGIVLMLFIALITLVQLALTRSREVEL